MGSKKGGAYEREICKRLSEWFSAGGYVEDDLFWRTHGSGARATARGKTGKRTKGQYGDVCAVDSRGRALTEVCVISLKRGYQRATIADIIDVADQSATPEFTKWIKDCVRDWYMADSFAWLLIVKRNTRRDLIFMPHHLFQALKNNGVRGLLRCTPQVQLVWDVRGKDVNNNALLNHVLNHCVIWGTTLDNFLAEVKRNDIVRIARMHRLYLKEQKDKDRLSRKWSRMARKQRIREKSRHKRKGK